MNAGAEYRAVAALSQAELVAEHAPLVKRIAWHLMGRLPASVEVEDLIQSGMIGLLEAARHYSAGKGANFQTFAGIRIRGAMLDELRKSDWTPRSVHRKVREAGEMVRTIENETGRDARDVEVARRMGIGLDEYHRVMSDAVGCRLFRLNDRDDEDDAPPHEIPDANAATPLENVADGDFRAALAAEIDGLPEREGMVMSLYYDDELNLKEIGAVLGVSESRVCQIHGQALVRLRARLAGWVADEAGAS
jgi:RNA polymerase sigma factor for flagellar operon FliA